MHQNDIIELLQQQDTRGLTAFCQHYTPLLRYIIAPIVVDAQEREACLSEVTMRIWEKSVRYSSKKGSWTAWITAIARNTALSYARKAARSPELSELTEQIASPEPTPEEVLLQKEREQAVMHALEQLSKKERILFYRKYYYRQPISQIAAELELTERSVEGKLYRLKKKLRVLLGGVFDV